MTSLPSPPTQPFSLPHLDIFALLLTEWSYQAPYKISTKLKYPKKFELWVNLATIQSVINKIKTHLPALLLCRQEDEKQTV